MHADVFLPSAGLLCRRHRWQSFSCTAQAILHISQPAVSKHVQALEEELGVALLQRVGKRVILTEAGQIVHHYAEQVRG
jgi:DNA-binding transcriptional LysR family regulator